MIESPLFRRLELQVLMDLTARALGQPSQRIWFRSADEALKRYARFTGSQLSEGASETQLLRMNSRAYSLGRWLRRLLLVRSEARAQRLIVALYRNIGIRLSFSAGQHLCFHRCYFSAYYTPAACRAASALDDGIIRGIMGRPERRLHFTQRITEGCSNCLATFQKPMELATSQKPIELVTSQKPIELATFQKPIEQEEI
ncbi:MAG: hypothetical protein K6C30_09220 [Bacteroidaceae bacterium]|nr:hypothetical protein [Bacteroidaceae bacterium]